MKVLLDTVRKTISEYSMLEKGDKVLCAVSGGADSMCLLNVLLALKDELKLSVYALHVNHLIRGEEAKRDSEFVKTFCKDNQIEFFYREYDVPKLSKERKIGEEECGRILRYEFFTEISEKLGGAKIATAHNLNDNAETVLFRLVRGSGSRGLSGIKYKRDNIIRPLLNVERKDIENYLNENGISWCEDSTNRETVYTRNKLRNCVIPILEEVSQGAQKKIVSAASLLSEDNDFLSRCAKEKIDECFFGSYILTKPLENAHVSVRRRTVLMILEKWGIKEITAEKINDFIEFLSKENGKSFDINSCVFAEKTYEKIFLRKRNEEKLASQILDLGKDCNGKDWTITLTISETKKCKSNDIAVFDADKISLPLNVRYRQDGDRIKQSGMHGSKKLSDIFTDEKIEKPMRDEIPIVEKEGEILFVCGIRKSSFCAPDENTRRYLVIEYKKN